MSHTGEKILATTIISLREVERTVVEAGVKAVFIDELHFFDVPMPTLQFWLNNNVDMYAATVERDICGKPNKLLQDLYYLRPCFHASLKATCDFCQIPKSATHTVRTQPVGATLVGGKEAYKVACDDCWY